MIGVPVMLQSLIQSLVSLVDNFMVAGLGDVKIQKRFVTMHTMMNKTTGILLFVLPLTVPIVALKYSAPLVCTAATFAAIQEGHYIRTGRDDL
jgi:Na+-driven multidrug efflux pump